MSPEKPLEVVLFHSVLGVRPSIRDWADRLRSAGFIVHVPDLYGGKVFDSQDEGSKHVESIGGIQTLIERTHAAVAQLPTEVAYAGFSNGGASAEVLVLQRPGARGALLLHAALPIAAVGAKEWPANVPVQVHYAERDPFRDQSSVVSFERDVRASGASFELFEYPVEGHLFADPGLAEYDASSAELMFERSVAFLRRVQGS